MKKKILLIIMMFLFITNVKALTFNIDITNIEDKGNNGTIGSIETINIGDKTLDVIFHDRGDEVNFTITITNTGNKVKLLRSITFESENPSIEYTSNVSDGGLVINGHDTNEITVTARLTSNPVNGKSTSKITIKYVYEESVCPKGEVLSDDESMCLCLDGTERNEHGICVTPEKPVDCADDEIYNEEKKICEKKVVPVPVTPSNPKTFDNIVLISLLFIVSGLGIYAAMFKKLNTNKKKITGGVITGVITFSLSFIVLASVFGLDNLLGAIADTISEERILIVDVNEEIDLIETWDGDCDIEGELTPENIFDGGTGTESDPYQIKTANQLACFAKSVNEGTTYEGQYVKQTRSIKLNDHLNDQATSGDLSNAHVWIPAGREFYNNGHQINAFEGTYNGDNYVISGLYVKTTNENTSTNSGLFGVTRYATIKNLILSDTYLDCFYGSSCSAVSAHVFNGIVINNVKTYGEANGYVNSGFVSNIDSTGTSNQEVVIQDSINNVNGVSSGFVFNIYGSIEMKFKNVTNNGNINNQGTFGGILAYAMYINDIELDNVINKGDIYTTTDYNSSYGGGLIGQLTCNGATIKNSYNSGNIYGAKGTIGGLIGQFRPMKDSVIEGSFNSGNLVNVESPSNYIGGLVASESSSSASVEIKDSYNSGDITGTNINTAGGLVGYGNLMLDNTYNSGNITTDSGYTGGLGGQLYGTTKNSYNSGKIENNCTWGNYIGGLIGKGINDLDTSYNAGDIIVNSDTEGFFIGGICADCGNIKNSYNRGNITANSYKIFISGIVARGKTVSNSYNSGSITITKGGLRTSEYNNKVLYAGIMVEGDSVTNSYNLGNIILNDDDTDIPTILAAGIGIGEFPVSNSVNSGNIKLNVTKKYSNPHTISLYGTTSSSDSTNNYNLGLVELDDSALDSPINEDDFNGEHHIITISDAINDSAPDILNIINGDDAFEIKEGETLPTLKVFNN